MSAIQDEDVKALTSLGLTMLQATVYLTLVELETLTIKDIAKNAGVARQDLYRITSELQERSLVEQIITKPIMYRAVPLKRGVTILLQDLQKKNYEANKRAKELLQRYKSKEAIVRNNLDKHQFILVPGKTLIFKEKKMIETAEKGIAIITSQKRLSKRLYSFSEEYKNIEIDNVKIRVIVEKGEDEKYQNSLNEIEKSYNEKISIEVKHVRNPPPVAMAIIDKKEVLIIASPDVGLTDSHALWSNNPSLVELSYSYFEMVWLKASKSKKT